MFEEIKTIVAENLGVEEDSITMESSFKDDLKADSLDLFEMVMELEENYGIEIPTDDLGQLETVCILFSCLFSFLIYNHEHALVS